MYDSQSLDKHAGSDWFFHQTPQKVVQPDAKKATCAQMVLNVFAEPHNGGWSTAVTCLMSSAIVDGNHRTVRFERLQRCT